MRNARPFLLMLLLVAVIGGGAVVASLVWQEPSEPTDPAACPSRMVTVEIAGQDVLLDDQAEPGSDLCDLTRRGPRPTEPYVAYDCRIVLPPGASNADAGLPDRIDPLHEAASCRQPG